MKTLVHLGREVKGSSDKVGGGVGAGRIGITVESSLLSTGLLWTYELYL